MNEMKARILEIEKELDGYDARVSDGGCCHRCESGGTIDSLVEELNELKLRVKE